jgi:hypothetical protein
VKAGDFHPKMPAHKLPDGNRIFVSAQVQAAIKDCGKYVMKHIGYAKLKGLIGAAHEIYSIKKKSS